MICFVEGYPGIHTESILKSVESDCIVESVFLRNGLINGIGKKEFSKQMRRLENSGEIRFVLLTLTKSYDYTFGDKKFSMNKIKAFYGKGFTSMKMKKIRIDFSSIGFKNVVERIDRFCNE